MTQPRDPRDPREPDLGELLRQGLGRMADETPRYLDTGQLREGVVTRVHRDRSSRRMVAVAAALVPMAAVAGWALGNAGDPNAAGVDVAAGGGTTSPTASASASVSPTVAAPAPSTAPVAPRPTPTTVPSASASPVPLTPATPPVPAVTPTATPDTTALIVELQVAAAGRSAGGAYRAGYTVNWSGGTRAPVSVVVTEVTGGGALLDSRRLDNPCAGLPVSDSVSGQLTFDDAGPHELVAEVRSGCGTDLVRSTDTVRWTWSATPVATASPTPTPTPDPSPSTTGGEPSTPGTGPGGSPSPEASPSGDASTATASPTPEASPSASGAGEPRPGASPDAKTLGEGLPTAASSAGATGVPAAGPVG